MDRRYYSQRQTTQRRRPRSYQNNRYYSDEKETRYTTRRPNYNNFNNRSFNSYQRRKRGRSSNQPEHNYNKTYSNRQYHRNETYNYKIKTKATYKRPGYIPYSAIIYDDTKKTLDEILSDQSRMKEEEEPENKQENKNSEELPNESIESKENTEKELREENEKTILLLCGYIHETAINIAHDVQERIRLFLWFMPKHSMICIAATHLIAVSINEYLNHENNKCEFAKNDLNDLNILKHVYIRGGALRDNYLLRNIKDIDFVVDINELTHKYLLHLKKYHSNIEQQDENCKCIFWRHYLNKYKSNDDSNIHQMLKHATERQTYNAPMDEYSTYDRRVDKILKFENFIKDCNFIINSRFIVNMLFTIFQTPKRQKKVPYESSMENDKKKDPSETPISHISDDDSYYVPYPIDEITIHSHFYGWLLKIDSYKYKGMCLDHVCFDICDQTGNSYARYQTFKDFKELNGISNVSNVVTDINKYINDNKREARNIRRENQPLNLKKLEISIPIYPLTLDAHVVYYDFTINSMHIDLESVLIDKSDMKNGYDIDFNWINKTNKIYENKVINKYNNIGINDLKNKILICPSLDIINKSSANYYFWRLTKTSQKFIYKIYAGIWKIDAELLKLTKKFYTEWFDHNFIMHRNALNANFIVKFLKWNICKKEDYIDRFNTFRFLKFEKHFINALNNYPMRLKQAFEIKISSLSFEKKRVLKKCFRQFGYPQMNINC